jgi:hypothetical protein
MNAQGNGLLGHPQMLDQPGGLPAEIRIVGWEPLREHLAGPETEVRCDRSPSRGQDREQAPELVTMGAEQVIDEIDDPWPVENVGPARWYWSDFQRMRARSSATLRESTTKRSSPASRSSLRVLRARSLQNCEDFARSFSWYAANPSVRSITGEGATAAA